MINRLVAFLLLFDLLYHGMSKIRVGLLVLLKVLLGLVLPAAAMVVAVRFAEAGHLGIASKNIINPILNREAVIQF